MEFMLHTHSTTAAQRGVFRRLGAKLKLTVLAGALALGASSTALANTIRFDNLTPETYNSGVTLNTQHFNLLLLEGAPAAAAGFVGSTGVIAKANDEFGCNVASCPSGASGNYLGILNDGAVRISLDGSVGIGFTLRGLDFAFIAPLVGMPNASYGQLLLNGVTTSGTAISAVLDLPGQNAARNFVFANGLLDAGFFSSILSSVTINACVYDADFACTNSVDSPAMNQAQFAVDNLQLNVVPEPSTALLLALGIVGLGAASRRRSTATARSNPLRAQGI